ncbi:hypothetical protein MKW98_018330 [Papaver atlanticum]|uniref:BHLH domain-containing protein n=1 Tax=Papaver atlanticum TaxID=357466 RepID=A0AAD4T7M9_9MAGN|nr:hypothetical protein MKW98_018330 [Papaver atlanticum]
MSERNRRKRLNKQLFTLRSMVPTITKMDKRSVLVDALTYLQDILDQTKIEIKNQNHFSTAAIAGTDDPAHAAVKTPKPPDSSTVNAEINNPPPHDQTGGVLLQKNAVDVNVEAGQLQQITSTAILEPSVLPCEGCAIFPVITKMEAEKVDEQRYVLKIVYDKAMGAMGQVQRAVEMLNGFHCINVSVSEYDQHHMQSSNFLRVKKTKGSLIAMDEERLLDKVKTAVEQLGLLLLPPDPSSV